MADCREVSPLLAALAFGALDDAERALVDAHLQRCEACRRQLALYRPLPGFMDLVSDTETEVASPPPLLEASVLAALPEGGAAARGGGARPRRPVRPSRAWARPRTALVGAVALALCAAVAIGIGIVTLTAGSRASSPALRLTLAASGPEPHARATALLRERPWGTEVDLVAHLAPTRNGEAYEVWFVAAAGRLSAGTFTVPAGRRQVTVRLASAARLGRYRYLGITLAPSSLDPARRGPNVLRARLPA